ncbi:MAG: glycoside hydrolase family 125 protein [Clostridiales bacterium]|nr:glycoside hydrolase family 125 protein [Clostridiales bacterium]
MNKNKTIQNVINTTCKKLNSIDKPELAKLFSNCFPNTWDTTVKVINEKDTFVITGDIPAMWLRDSAAQVNHYLPYAKDDEEIYNVIVGVINRYVLCVSKDPYANAFNEIDNNHGYSTDHTSFRSHWVWERKYEVDSLCSVISLPYKLYKSTGRTDFFTQELKETFKIILNLWEKEQNHPEKSDYFFHRENTDIFDTLPLNGKGNPVGYTGMTWSGFRPSDDTCTYNYLIPSEMFAVVTLGYLEEIFEKVYKDQILLGKTKKLKEEIDLGINKFGLFNHEKYGTIYKFEVDGLGNYLLMDDANCPSLLGVPYLGYCDKNDEIYQNTRKYILSSDNPYYYSGAILKGVGSPHTRPNCVWPIALIIQGLTTDNKSEIENILDMLCASHAGTYYMHESINCDDPAIFSRKWFAWANSLFSELVLKYVKEFC